MSRFFLGCFQILFGLMILMGIVLLMIWGAGSHGHFRFRPHMTEDWICWGTPIIGVLGFIWMRLIKKSIQNK